MTRINKGHAAEPKALSDRQYHVSQCEPCQRVIWSRIVETALWRARHEPVKEEATAIYARALYGIAA